MMLSYERFAFASAPRTGTAYMVDAFERAGLGNQTRAKVHEPFPSDYKGYTVSMVRHPYDWLVSYYYEIPGAMINIAPIDNLITSYQAAPNNVHDFIRAACSELGDNFVGDIFDIYNASMYLRIEDMPRSLYEFLDTIDVVPPFGISGAVQDRKNINKFSRFHDVDEDVRRLVVERNLDFCERFEYYG